MPPYRTIPSNEEPDVFKPLILRLAESHPIPLLLQECKSARVPRLAQAI